jgi:hypothetical protein
MQEDRRADAAGSAVQGVLLKGRERPRSAPAQGGRVALNRQRRSTGPDLAFGYFLIKKQSDPPRVVVIENGGTRRHA